MRIVKLILGAAIVVLLIVVAAAAIFLLTFDENENKQAIIDVVKEETGRELVLDGDIGLSVFPKIAITLGPAQLSNAQGFTATTFAQVEKATASVEVMPLFIGNVQIGMIELQGLLINLESKASGENNWDDLTGSAEYESEKDDEPSDKALAMSIGGIQISEAQVHYVDHKSKSTLRVDLVELETGALGRGDLTHIHSEIRLRQDDTRLQLVLDTQASTDFANMRYQLKDLELNLMMHMVGLPDGQLGLRMTGNGIADLKQESIRLDPFTLALGQDLIQGAFNLESFSQPRVNFSLSSKELNLDPWLTTCDPAGAGAHTKGGDDLIVLPTKMLRSLNILGGIEVTRLNASGLSLENVKAQLIAKSGILELRALDADFYQGHINAKAKLDVSRARPNYFASSMLQDIQIAPLMNDLMATKKPLMRGQALAEFKIKSSGERISQLRQNLNGDMHFKVSDGAVISKGLTRTFEQAGALLEGRKAKPPGEEILLKEASGTASIVAGLLQNNDLIVQTPLLDGHGRGQVNITNGTIDYALKVGMPNSADKVGLPIRLHGSWADIKYSIDMKDALKGKADELFDKEKDKIEKKIQKKTKDLWGDKLKKLF